MTAANKKKLKFKGRKAIELKPVISSILLFLALSSQLGTYIVYVVQQELTKESIAQQMAQKLPQSALVKIKNSPAIEWEEEGREFYKEGSFYDIVKTEIIKGETWFYCINDTMQTQLYNNYTASLKSHNDALPLGKQSKQLVKFSLSYFIIQSGVSVLTLAHLNSTYYNTMSQEIKLIATEVQAPPPRFV